MPKPVESATPFLPTRPPPLRDLFFSFLRLGAVAFGGPAMVAYIQKLAVGRKRWLTESDLASGVALCQAIPGATAIQCAAYVGLRARGMRGAFLSYVGFALPAFAGMLGLSIVYGRTQDVVVVTKALAGLRILVVALVAYGAWTFGRRFVRSVWEMFFAATTAVLFLIGASPLLVVVGSAIMGLIVFHRALPSSAASAEIGRSFPRSTVPLLIAAVALPAVLLALNSRLAHLALLMMKIDATAFGGGFASIPLMLHEFVDARKWMPASVFMDGIALGQVTPGPIVITATFVGYARAGLPGALAATAGIFLPSWILLVLLEPWFARLQASARFRAALKAVLLSFVGLLLFATLRFSLVAPWSWPSAVMATAAFAALLLRVDVVWVVLVGAGVSILIG